MKHTNIEIKASVGDLARIRSYLITHDAEFIGKDHQVDTYFNTPQGRLKIRRGTVESCIVYYERPNSNGPRTCRYHIEHYSPGDPSLDRMHTLLAAALGIQTEVEKHREIYFIGNAKFHLDEVTGLGTFFEIEVIGDRGQEESELRLQCNSHLMALDIRNECLIPNSYSDMLTNVKQEN